ncbi:MAG TPA: aminotransferase class I/II-fold pyridoxal phosphate-dependent enzyme [Streptosporangiaceae bacterium]|nr:aminotransferase class I/II-fold pyridoxal phosphate-dependent enzyme [Streptosporangiaceae bacterium]
MNRLLGDCSLDALRRRRSWKWTEYPPDVLPAWVAEMDFDLAEPIKDAVREAIGASDCGYPHPAGFGEAYAEFATQRFGWAPGPGQVFAIPDVMTGVAEVLQEVTPHGSGVVINPPVYPPFFFRLRLAGRRVVEAPLRCDSDGRYHLDIDAVDAALAADDVAAYLLCSPHNPTGRVWSSGDLAAVAAVCERRDVALIVDEIHAPLALPGARHIPFLSLDLDEKLARRTFTFTSASKGWNIPGLKCGLAVIGHPEAAVALERRWEALLASHLGVLATMAAFRDCDPWLNAACAQLDENRVLLAKLLAQQLPTVNYQPPEASFLAWLDCRGLGAPDPAATFLGRGRVALSSGQDFGELGNGFVRLNMGTSPAILEEMVRRMAAAAGPERLI